MFLYIWSRPNIFRVLDDGLRMKNSWTCPILFLIPYKIILISFFIALIWLWWIHIYFWKWLFFTWGYMASMRRNSGLFDDFPLSSFCSFSAWYEIESLRMVCISRTAFVTGLFESNLSKNSTPYVFWNESKISLISPLEQVSIILRNCSDVNELIPSRLMFWVFEGLSSSFTFFSDKTFVTIILWFNWLLYQTLSYFEKSQKKLLKVTLDLIIDLVFKLWILL